MERIFKLNRWVALAIKFVLALAVQSVLWEFFMPDGCPSMARYYAEQCSKSTILPGTLLFVAATGIVLLGDIALVALHRRRSRGNQG